MTYSLFKRVVPATWAWALFFALLLYFPAWFSTAADFQSDVFQMIFMNTKHWVVQLGGFLLLFLNSLLLYQSFYKSEALRFNSLVPFLALFACSSIVPSVLFLHEILVLQSLGIMLLHLTLKFYDLVDHRKIVFDSGVIIFFMSVLFSPAVLMLLFLLVNMAINKIWSVRLVIVALLGFFVPVIILFCIEWVFDFPSQLNSGTEFMGFSTGLSFVPHFFQLGTLLILVVVGIVGYYKSIEEQTIRIKTKSWSAGIWAVGWLVLSFFIYTSTFNKKSFTLLSLSLAIILSYTLTGSKSKWTTNLVLLLFLLCWIINTYIVFSP